jgi:catechol 2,3-dioxygenase
VHLTVSDIPATVEFYRDVVGLDLMAHMPSAAFMSAGGYHHHLGANTWETAGRPHAPPGTAALRHATLVLPDTAERDRVVGRIEAAGHPVEDGGDPAIVDPSGNRIVLSV